MARQHDLAQAVGGERSSVMDKPETLFTRHWLYYIVLKYGVLAAAVLLALYVFYRVL